ncbi:MAG: hypothetical protein C4K47_01585 [Candidatus Thorarchaeota archaeon]|nr:MAG: hypothetical protein C4K47_01585 [Candidatus Thorarchaeota archaeon]
MRIFFRRKEYPEGSPDGCSPERHHSHLGIFSPVSSPSESEVLQDFKKLCELDAIYIRSKRLESLDDVPFVVNEIREGTIVLLDISRLNDGKEQGHLELKRIIERIRGETRGFGAEIALVNDNCVIVTPSFVRF